MQDHTHREGTKRGWKCSQEVPSLDCLFLTFFMSHVVHVLNQNVMTQHPLELMTFHDPSPHCEPEVGISHNWFVDLEIFSLIAKNGNCTQRGTARGEECFHSSMYSEDTHFKSSEGAEMGHWHPYISPNIKLLQRTCLVWRNTSTSKYLGLHVRW